ncbi:adhesion G protein-coupled receptor E1-like [Mytilus trossulus]|uniref:adhesion G protein-coupled receptor E1-like n=1 Tax=Mytilus trossulus TaxID=6551 RepID=UPI0030073842
MKKECFIMHQIDTLPVRNCSQNEEIHFDKCNMTGSGCVAPIDIPGVKIRNLFQIGQTKTSDEPWDVQYCSDGQLYDKVEKNCRDITCFPGRHLIGGNCDPLFTVTRNIRYNLEVFIRNADSSEQFNGTEKIILRWLENIVRNHSIGITSMVILKSEIFSNFPCSLGQSNPNVFTYIKSTTEYALEITTIVCTCVSLFCLLVTFITYCIFPILRTLPGKNNMCLIFSLLIAQTCLQFGTIWTDHIFICKAIGIILHVFWLATFACMNVCSYHMYSVFTTFRPTSSMSENNGLFLRYVCYSYGTPFVIVIINIAIQIVLSGGANIGYGGSNCFISDIPQIAAFICPVGVICLVNIWLFGFTAYTIYTRPIIRSTANDKQDFYVYIKLFSLTGITWIGQIVDSFIPLSVFSFVVTILTGLQGLFIFLSFVCNKRVYNLFLGMCKYNHSESVRESIRLYSLSEVNYHDKYIKRYPITKPSKIS